MAAWIFMSRHRDRMGRRASVAARLALGLMLVVLGLASGPARAQDANAAADRLVIELSAGQDPGSIEAAIRAATAGGRPVTIRWRDPQGAPASAAPAAVAPAPVSVPETDLGASWLAGIAGAVSGIAGIPAAAERTFDHFASRAGAGSGEAGRILLATLLAAVLALVVRRLLPSAEPLEHGADLRVRARSSSRSALAHLAALGVFVALATLAHRSLLTVEPAGAEVASALLRVLSVTGIYLVTADWLLSPRRPQRRMLAMARPGWHFGMLVAYGAIGSLLGAVMDLGQSAGVDAQALRALSFLGVTLITVLKIVWFGVGRHDIASAFAGPKPGLLRRGAADAYPWLLIGLALVLWGLGCLSTDGARVDGWNATARTTQVLSLLVPLAAMGFHALAAAFLHRHETDGRPVVAAALVAARVLATGAIWLGGLFVVTRLWTQALADTDAGDLPQGLDHALRIGLGIVAGWSLWTFASAFFRIHVPQGGPAVPGTGEEEAQGVPATRLSTVLPLIRDVALGLVLAVTALLVLSALGLDIAPLLAGFGVFGLAISFGSQALVKDIVSGVFFIADDAFRVGEYIDTGRLKGTVERISLRSVRLRHQNGQFHTLPFGQMQSITNYSRDWSVVKFELKFDLGVDVEKLRRTVKRVGLEIMDDPELSAQLLQPLKMQGIQDVTETALVVRLKFTAKPGNPSLVQREAIKRLLAAFRADGIALASTSVAAKTFLPDASAATPATDGPKPPLPAHVDQPA